MAKELAFVLVDPYIISKSRTGGVLSRIVSRTGLELVAARMFGPSQELVEEYAQAIRTMKDLEPQEAELIADYVLHKVGPDPKSGKRRRNLLLLFEGESAVSKVSKAVGHPRPHAESGETVRDTFGDFIVEEDGKPAYFEPAVFTAHSKESAGSILKLLAKYSASDGGVIDDAEGVPEGEDIQRTLVILKPDNFQYPSSRPGNIIDLFSASGLRIIGAKVHRMSVAEGEEFYGPVREVLRNKLKAPVAERATAALTEEFGFSIPEEIKTQIGELVGPCFGDEQFYQIIQFMAGDKPTEVKPEDKAKPGKERCLVLIYKGKQAVDRIRTILGPTDPSKASPGSVRKEYGKDIMINAAHASDSPENAVREMGIVKPEADTIAELVARHYA
ncbi:MAG: nucleoside-diphosphate kinase [Verrucomicrobia bacterium]|nr:nucleoside-diphosphate kinase [Kiritimatiellia bacterium]MCB1102157.1 nucleoside-diphosphate kinase [Kiritimatiellia bacterium]MCP5488319.1 nucleoside-diphosphate kinase [Verrucomicrobiota bacterium]